MTLGEFKNKFENIPDNTNLAIVLSDGQLDYAVQAFLSIDVDDKRETILISGN